MTGLSVPSVSFPQMLPGLLALEDTRLTRAVTVVREFFGLIMAVFLLVVIFPGSDVPPAQKVSTYAYVFFAGITTYHSRSNLYRHAAIISHLAGFTAFTLGNAAYSYFVSHDVLRTMFWAAWLPGVYVEGAMSMMPRRSLWPLAAVFGFLVLSAAACFVWPAAVQVARAPASLFLLIPVLHIGAVNLLNLASAVGDQVVRSVAGHRAALLEMRETAERRLHAELIATQQQLERMNRSLTMSALAASIAHEISQPLAAVVTNAGAALRWLEEDRTDIAEARQALMRVVADGHRTSAVIASFRAMLSQDGPERLALDLRTVVDEALEALASEIQKHCVTVLRTGLPNIPVIHGDKVQLRQVVLNLISNAIEAMIEVIDRPRLLIIRLGQDDFKRAVLCVEDSGIGLATKDPGRIFEAFFTTKTKGMGMGLFISRMIAEAHGGTMSVDSRPGRTRFYVTIPVENPRA